MMEYDADAKIFHGDVINTQDVITFQGTTVEELEMVLRESIDFIFRVIADMVQINEPNFHLLRAQ